MSSSAKGSEKDDKLYKTGMKFPLFSPVNIKATKLFHVVLQSSVGKSVKECKVRATRLAQGDDFFAVHDGFSLQEALELEVLKTT